jgi:short-subunit dehydrogenase
MKRVFLTGASSGIGLAIAKTLVAHGHEVWGTSRDIRRIPPMPQLHAVALDLRDQRSVIESFNAALQQAGRFDVLINNAGSGHFGPAESLSREQLVNYFQILVFAQIELIRLALASMGDQGHGLIINVTSLASRLPVPFMAAYNAAKAALASFTMTMQLELQGHGIHLVDLQPADISTNFNDAVTRTAMENARVKKTWQVVDRNMRAAPKPERVATQVLKLIEQKNPPPRITVGDFFQSTVAPMIFRFLPQRVRIWGLKKYYGM